MTLWLLLALHHAETVEYRGLHRALTPVTEHTAELQGRGLLRPAPYPAGHLMLSPAGQQEAARAMQEHPDAPAIWQALNAGRRRPFAPEETHYA